ncbi:hypothetical protein RN001_011715 [Aquatica leii]|uniref:Osiris 20 n=1 Tax=Aquatica leii TaxID=1421715 RepID=A0AAN7SM51_9COLE|nr:hypothetical protein RN001_011715 [Aquatica leii]
MTGKFSFSDMLLLLGFCERNCSRSIEEYRRRYPKCVMPHRETFSNNERQARETASALIGGEIRSGNHLVSSVISNCVDMGCVKENVISYLDTVLNQDVVKSRQFKNMDTAILKRVSRILKTHEFRITLPEVIFDKTQIVYNPKNGLDVVSADEEGRGLLKKKLLLPILLLLKLKMKALLPIFVAIIGLKAFKALILSKLAIAIVLGFVIYQLLTKSGMPMPMTMTPAEPPAAVYGPPASTAAPNSYEPGWEPNSGGPYSRVWNSAEAQNLAYSAYYPGPVSSTTATI